MGQAAPVYIAMVAGLLFLALAFFAVGQAGATRNGAQSGADAAALAAAQESRDELGSTLWQEPVDLDFLRRLLAGEPLGTTGAGCAAADRLAAENGTLVTPGGCTALGDGRWGFTVRVRSQKPVGDTILPGTENQHAEATATAVVEPLCAFDPDEPVPTSSQSEPTTESSPGDDGGEPAEEPPLGRLLCDDGDFDLDPQNPDTLPDMSDLLTVRLAED
ncbi:pilus assembly protein TadG-related protein [Streptomyces sp. NPDC004838]